jgi:hypothetical protein
MVLLYKEPSAQPSPPTTLHKLSKSQKQNDEAGNYPFLVLQFLSSSCSQFNISRSWYVIKAKTFYLYLYFFFSHFFHPEILLINGADDEKEFDYDEKSGKGPAHWGELHPEWSTCKNGSMQSPIDLLDERVEVVSHLGRLKRSYNPSNATITNRGHDMMVRKRREGDRAI